MPRRSRSNTAAAEGLRELLIAEADAGRERWRQPRAWDWPGLNRGLPMLDWELDLRAGRAVVVSSTQLMCALGRAGLPYDRFGYGGADWRKVFVLDEFGGLTEWTG